MSHKAHAHHFNVERQGFGGTIDHMDLLMISIHDVMRCHDYEVMGTEEAVLTWRKWLFRQSLLFFVMLFSYLSVFLFLLATKTCIAFLSCGLLLLCLRPPGNRVKGLWDICATTSQILKSCLFWVLYQSERRLASMLTHRVIGKRAQPQKDQSGYPSVIIKARDMAKVLSRRQGVRCRTDLRIRW